jgi:hypothetical protein
MSVDQRFHRAPQRRAQQGFAPAEAPKLPLAKRLRTILNV